MANVEFWGNSGICRKDKHYSTIILAHPVEKRMSPIYRTCNLTTTWRHLMMLKAAESMYHCCPYVHRRPCSCLTHKTWALEDPSVSISGTWIGVPVNEERMISNCLRITHGPPWPQTIKNIILQIFTRRPQRHSTQQKCNLIIQNLSTPHRLQHPPPLARFRLGNRQSSTRLQRILRSHSGET